MAGIRIGGSGVVVTCSPPLAAFGGSATSGDPQVYRSCSDDTAADLTAITDFSGFTDADQCYNPVLSPDGTMILFEVLGAISGFREVWVVDNIPGSTATQLVADASNYVIHPAWGPDSDTFLYVHCAGGALQGGTIFKDTVSSPGTPTALKAATGGLSPFRPMFNFDGTRVAYIFDEDSGSGAAELRCMDDDGTNDASLDNTLQAYLLNDPPQLSWANTQNLIAYSDAEVARNTYVIADDGTGKTQLDANGFAAGAATNVSGFAWPADDSFVVITGGAADDGNIAIVRAEVDGSNTTKLGTTGVVNSNWFRGALVYNSRIWFISTVTTSGTIRSMALDGTDETENFGNGTGTLIKDFGGGDGWYFN